ncbi:unnamed protein product [Knipowitschia caucasica]
MHNWQDHEIRQLLRIRAHDQFRGQLTGTVKDAVVFSTIARLLAKQGVQRSRDQVVSKLKNLKKQYRRYKAQTDGNSSWVWPFYEEAERAFGPIPAGSPGVEAAPLQASAPVRSQRPEFDPVEAEKVVVGDWGEQNQGPTPNVAIKREHEPLDDEEEFEYECPPQTVQSVQPNCPIPTKKRKTSIVTQVNNMINATMGTLRDMDRDMQAQEDARLKRLMDHEKDMQRSLIQDMLSLHRTISAENHKRHLELVDRIMTKVPLSSSQPAL